MPFKEISVTLNNRSKLRSPITIEFPIVITQPELQLNATGMRLVIVIANYCSYLPCLGQALGKLKEKVVTHLEIVKNFDGAMCSPFSDYLINHHTHGNSG